MDTSWRWIVVAVVLMATAPATLASHGTNLTPDPMPQDCDGNVDDNEDGIGAVHHYSTTGVLEFEESIFPIVVSNDPPGASSGGGENGAFGAMRVSDRATDWCPEEPDPFSGPLGMSHFDGELEFGVGGAFLNELHHGGFVCVEDDALGLAVEFSITADHDGDGVSDEVQPVSVGCDEIAIPAGVGPPSKNPAANCWFDAVSCGLQRGWWVMVHAPATSGGVQTVLDITCGPDTLMGPTGKARAGGTPNEFQGTVNVGIKVGAGRVLVSEGVVQVGGPAGAPGTITEVPHAGNGPGTEHKWNVGASSDFNTRTYSYSFTTQCIATGDFSVYSGTFKVYN